jgi:hypothetical protein
MNDYEIGKLYESFEDTGMYRADKVPKGYRRSPSYWMKKSYMSSGIMLIPSTVVATFNVSYPRYMFDIDAKPETLDGWYVRKYINRNLSNHGSKLHVYMTFYKEISGTAGYAMQQAMNMRKHVMESFRIFKPKNYNWRTKDVPKLINTTEEW